MILTQADFHFYAESKSLHNTNDMAAKSDCLNWPEENINRNKEFLKISRIPGARIGLKIDVKKTKSLKTGNK